VLATITTQLLQIVGPLLAGGILLLWVCWKMWRELHGSHQEDSSSDTPGVIGTDKTVPRKTLSQAALQIVIADISMSLDNVLAVAGAAREHPHILIFRSRRESATAGRDVTKPVTVDFGADDYDARAWCR
jgi:predicted tellurium resistance membrane protein TerC